MSTHKAIPATKTAARKVAPAKAANQRRFAPAKKAPPPKPPADEPLEGEVLTADTDAGEQDPKLHTATVPFRGRQVEVQMPTLEQAAIYKRVAARFAELQGEGGKAIDGPQAVNLYDRAIRIVTSVLVHQHDLEWIEDLLLDRALTLDEVLPLLREAMEQLRKANAHLGTRAEKRARARLAD